MELFNSILKKGAAGIKWLAVVIVIAETLQDGYHKLKEKLAELDAKEQPQKTEKDA